MSRWATVPIRSLGKGRDCLFVDGDWIESPYITDQGVRLLQTGNIGLGEFKEQGFRYISDETFDELACTEVLPGDVLICRLADPVGRSCIAPDLGVRMVTSVDVAILRPDTMKASPTYLNYALTSHRHLSDALSIARGSTRTRISRGQLGRMTVPLPSLPEQGRIAEFLDAETSRIDALIAEYENQALLIEEEVAACLDQVLFSSAALSFDLMGVPQGVEGISSCPLKRWATVSGGVTVDAKRDTTDALSVPYLRVANVQDGELDLDEIKDIRLPPDLIRRYSLQRGDLLLTEGGDPDKLGRGAVWPGTLNPCVHQNHVFSVRPSSTLNSHYLALVTKSSFGKAYFEATGSQTTGIASTNMTKVKSLPVPFRTPEEQTLIVREAEQIQGVVDATTAILKSQIGKLGELRQALITTAVSEGVEACRAVV